MRTPRTLLVGTALALVCVACGTDVALDEEPTVTPTETATATEAPTESPTADPTEATTPSTTPTLDPTATATPFPIPRGIDYHAPSAPEVVGTGLIEEFTLDGSGLLVSEELVADDTVGCEGFPPPVLQRVDFGSGDKTVAIDDPDAYGAFTRDGSGRVIVTSQCEGFFVAQYLANESASGELVVTGEVPYEGSGPAQLNYVDLRASDPDATVVIAGEPGSAGGPATVGSLDPATGVVTPLLEGDYFEAVRVFGDGLLVSSFEGEVTLFDSSLDEVESWAADWAFVSPDRTAGILVEGNNAWLVEFGTGISALIATLPNPIGDLAWAPDGTAVVAVTFESPGRAFMMTLDGQVTEIAGPGEFARPAFSPAGDAVAFNDFTEPSADFTFDAVVVTFG